MIRAVRKWPIETAARLTTAGLPLLCLVGSLGGSPAQGQGFIRSPSLHVESRVSIAPRVSPGIAGRVGVGRVGASLDTVGRTSRVAATPAMRAVSRIAVGSTLPYMRYSPNLYPVCDYAYRGSDGECYDRPVALIDGRQAAKGSSAKGKSGGPRNNAAQTAVNLSAVSNELVAEIDGALTDLLADELARRHGLIRVGFAEFSAVGDHHRSVPHYRSPSDGRGEP